jgi:nucleoside-diphosphate-sugar epimerase
MILVVGSTGLLGGSVARKLVGAGRNVSAMVRDPSSEKARALESAGAEIVSGDLKDRAGLERVIRGADAVVCTATSTLSRREGDSIDAVDVAGVRSLIEVAEAAAVRRFVFISISPSMGDDFPLATPSALRRSACERRGSTTLSCSRLISPKCGSRQ